VAGQLAGAQTQVRSSQNDLASSDLACSRAREACAHRLTIARAVADPAPRPPRPITPHRKAVAPAEALPVTQEPAATVHPRSPVPPGNRFPASRAGRRGGRIFRDHARKAR
jgi:hypothetical protein